MNDRAISVRLSAMPRLRAGASQDGKVRYFALGKAPLEH
jgi:hypothetical protein